MTWTKLNDVVSGLNQTVNSVIAAFQGRSNSFTVATFFGVVANNLDVAFVDQSSSPGLTITSWAWDFGDGATSSVQNPTHTYAAAGDYIVTLTVTDSAGHAGSHSATVSPVADSQGGGGQIPTPPTASFTVAKNSLTVTLTDTSTDPDGTVTAWDWDFGEEPTSAFTYSVSGLASTFTDQSTTPGSLTISSWSWNFGDGTTSASSNTKHTYAAGGTYPVQLTVTSSNGVTDDLVQSVQVTSGVSLGLVFGAEGTFSGNATRKSAVTYLGMSRDDISPSNFTTRVNWASDNGVQLFITMTGGAHSDYLTNGVFDPSKWTAKQAAFNTAAIKSSMASAVANKVIVGNSVMDEPFHHSWGPKGTITKAGVDDMAQYVKSIFSTLAVGADHAWQQFEPTKSYKTIDYIWSCYQKIFGDETAWMNSTLSMCVRDGHKVVFGVNILDGGSFINNCISSATCCPQPSTEGVGTYVSVDHYNCRMTGSQLTYYSRLFGPNGAGYCIWRYDTEWNVSSSTYSISNQSAIKELHDFFATLPYRTWTRGVTP